jgi:hypothetical protein
LDNCGPGRPSRPGAGPTDRGNKATPATVTPDILWPPAARCDKLRETRLSCTDGLPATMTRPPPPTTDPPTAKQLSLHGSTVAPDILAIPARGASTSPIRRSAIPSVRMSLPLHRTYLRGPGATPRSYRYTGHTAVLRSERAFLQFHRTYSTRQVIPVRVFLTLFRTYLDAPDPGTGDRQSMTLSRTYCT